VADEAKERIVRAKTFLIRPFRVGDLMAAVHEAVAPAGATEIDR
jgi:hypothetical protein